MCRVDINMPPPIAYFLGKVDQIQNYASHPFSICWGEIWKSLSIHWGGGRASFQRTLYCGEDTDQMRIRRLSTSCLHGPFHLYIYVVLRTGSVAFKRQ